MSLAKSLGIPLTSTEEEIQETQIFRVFLFRMQTYDEQESALECDRDELHTQLLFFSEK